MGWLCWGGVWCVLRAESESDGAGDDVDGGFVGGGLSCFGCVGGAAAGGNDAEDAVGAEEFEGVADRGAGYAGFRSDGVPGDADGHGGVVGVAEEDPEDGENVALRVFAAFE